MKSWLTTARRWQEPMSKYWEEVIDGVATGRIVLDTKDINDPSKILSWDDIDEMCGPRPHPDLDFFPKSKRLECAKTGTYLDLLKDDPCPDVANEARRKLAINKLKR